VGRAAGDVSRVSWRRLQPLRRGMAGRRWLRHGRPERLRVRGYRSGAVHGVRVRDGSRSRHDGALRLLRSSSAAGRRPALPRAVPRRTGGLMRVPLKWLREFVDVDVDVEELAVRLSWTGSAVDKIERFAPGLSGVVVGRVLDVKDVPESDKLVV